MDNGNYLDVHKTAERLIEENKKLRKKNESLKKRLHEVNEDG